VAETDKKKINWPSFEVDIQDQFSMHVFTLPDSIQLELVVADQVIDRINLVIPGGHVKTLTSTSKIIHEYEFSRRQRYFENYAEKLDIKQELQRNELTQPQKLKLKQEVDKFDKAKMDLDGSVFVKAEW
jgi:hypothetical protein